MELKAPTSPYQVPTGYVPRPVAVYSPHALLPQERRTLVYDALKPGETLAVYLERTGLMAAIGQQPVVITIDGYRVPRDLWAKVRPKHGTLIGIRALVRGGGGGGKNPIATVLSLAIAVFNPGAALLNAAGIANSAIFGSLMLSNVVNFGLGLVVSALFPPPRPQIAQAQNPGAAASPTYSLTGGGNRARPFEPLPMIAGTHRVFFDLGARTFTEFEGDDAYLYQVFNAGYNTLTLGDYRIGATPIDNYNGVTIEESGSDGVLELFPGNVDTTAGGDVSRQANGWVQRTSSPGSTALAVELTGSLYGVNDEGTVSVNEVYMEIEYRAVGSATWLDFQNGTVGTQTIVIQNGTRTPVRKTYKITVAEGQYEVRVRKTSADATTSAAVYEIQWTQLRSYQPDTADYTGQQRVALKIKASGQLSGQVEQLSAIARAQCLAWNGASWALAETSNPAWWFRAIALGRFVTLDGVSRRVWGAGLDASRVDDESIKAWGAWCATKNLTFNGVFDRAMSAQDMLLAVATVGRASPTWANGRLGVVYDQASQPVTAVFGMSNIIAGSFSIAYQTEQLADEILVSFINPDLDWQRDTVRCLVPGTTTPTKTRQIELFGCTSLDMAGRAGNLYAAQNAYRTRRFTWRSDFEAMPCARGDVVQLSHDLATYDYSGRLVEGSTASVLVLERTVPLAAGGSWITLVQPDGTISTHAVAAGSGDSASLTLVTALAFNPGADPDHPPYDYKWLYGSTDTPGLLLKIDSLKPIDESTVEITAIDELDAFYAAEDADYTYTPPRPIFGSANISNLAVTETGIRVGMGYQVSLAVTWDAGADYGGAEVYAALNDGPEILRGSTSGRSFAFVVEDGDVAVIRVVARSVMGRLVATTQLSITHTTSFADNFPPVDVTTFLISGTALSWLPVGDVDVAGYRIKFNYGTNTDWTGAAKLHEGLLTASPWTMPVRPAGAITLMIKAVDVAGIESVNPAVITTSLDDTADDRIVETIDLDALGYPGTLTGGSVSGGDLMASSGTAFWNTNEEVTFWQGADSAAYWPASTYSAMVYEAAVTPSAAYTGATMTIEAGVTASLWTLEYRPQGPDPFWATASGDPFWDTDTAADFWGPKPDYQPWPGSLAVTNQPYDVRLTTGAGATQGVVATLTLEIHVPVLTERLNDVVIAATTGTRLPVTKTFQAIDNVQITVQADGNNAISARIDDKLVSGPLVKTLDAGGTSVAGLIDAVITGYAP